MSDEALVETHEVMKMRISTLRWTAAWLGILIGTSWTALARAEGRVEVEQVAYGGWPNCIRISNGTVELIATTDVGPRIIRYGFVGRENEFFEDPQQMGKTNSQEWLAFGGHRLWLAPEAKPRSYFPDSQPIQHRQKGGTLRLIQPVETTNGIQKTIELTLAPTGSHVKLIHRLTNHNLSGTSRWRPGR